MTRLPNELKRIERIEMSASVISLAHDSSFINISLAFSTHILSSDSSFNSFIQFFLFISIHLMSFGRLFIHLLVRHRPLGSDHYWGVWGKWIYHRDTQTHFLDTLSIAHRAKYVQIKAQFSNFLSLFLLD